MYSRRFRDLSVQFLVGGVGPPQPRWAHHVPPLLSHTAVQTVGDEQCSWIQQFVLQKGDMDSGGGTKIVKNQWGDEVQVIPGTSAIKRRPSAEAKIDAKLSNESEIQRKAVEERRLQAGRSKQEQLKAENAQKREGLKAAGSRGKADKAIDARTEFIRKKMEEKRQEFLLAAQAAKEAQATEYQKRIAQAGTKSKVDQVPAENMYCFTTFLQNQHAKCDKVKHALFLSRIFCKHQRDGHVACCAKSAHADDVLCRRWAKRLKRSGRSVRN